MHRDLEQLKNQIFDILIIGGGVHGATLAYEASRNGLKTCLIEKSDFGSETSANSLKVLHGGLRYLQHANFKRMRESIYSRKVFQQIAPHLVKNVPFLMPTKGFTVKSKFALKVAMKLNDMISYDRNKNILDGSNVKGGKTISKNEFEKIVPKLNDNSVTGGAVWYETIATNTERLSLEFLSKATKQGSSIANYVEAKKYNFKNSEITSVEVEDKLKNERFNIKAKHVVNTVGPWLNEILTETNDIDLLKTPLTKAVNIIVKGELFGKYAVGLESYREFKDKAAIVNKGKRLFFFVPLNGFTMIGTTYKVYNKSFADECKISEEDIKEIFNEVNNAYKNLNLTLADVTQTHVGLQAMSNEDYKNEFQVQPETHSLVFNHETEGSISNLISVKSVKYTTAPAIAKKIVEALGDFSEINYKNELANYKKLKKVFFNNSTEINLERIWKTYGTKSIEVLEYINKNEENKKIIFEDEQVFFGEILYCLENEMAVTEKDIVDRRLGISALNKVPQEYYQKVNEIIKSYERRN